MVVSVRSLVTLFISVDSSVSSSVAFVGCTVFFLVLFFLLECVCLPSLCSPSVAFVGCTAVLLGSELALLKCACFPFSLLPSVAFIGCTVVSFPEIGLSECGLSVCFFLLVFCCPRRDFAQKAKSRGGTLVTRTRILRKVLTVELYSHTVNIEKISIGLNRGREESVGNDDVSIVCARKYEMVRMR